VKDNPANLPETGVAGPLDVMRKVFEEAELHFEEIQGMLSLHLRLDNLDVSLLCSGQDGDVASIILQIPVRATKEYRARTGEFLHRLNFSAKRKFWELDYDDGEIRLASYSEIINCPLTGGQFRGILHALLCTANLAFPYLTKVISGSMTPEFAADQAEAAIQAYWDKLRTAAAAADKPTAAD
jgi:hypothetical protein